MVPPRPQSKRKSKSVYIQNATIRIQKDPDAYEATVQDSMEKFFDDKLFWESMGPSMQMKLERMMNDWEFFIGTRPLVDEDKRFTPETFYKYSGAFIESKVIDTPGRRNPDKVHWSTLEQWLTYLVKLINTFCVQNVNGKEKPCGQKLLREGLEPGDTGLFLLLARYGHQLFKTYALDKWRKKKVYWTRYELNMLIDEAFNTSASMEVALQQVLLLTLAFLTSARVGAFGYSYEEWKAQGKARVHNYMKLGDIELRRDLNILGAFDMTVTIKNVKGYNETKGSVPITISLLSLQNPWNLFLEAAPPFIALLLHRKQLRDHDSLESLLNGKEHRIHYKNDDDPLFYACSPGGYGVKRTEAAGARDLCEQVARIAHKAGLIESDDLGGGSLKAFRKWGAEDLKNQVSEKFAQQALGHKEVSSVLEDNYARGVETVDMAALRAHESRDGNARKSDDALLRHISRDPAVRARAARLAGNQPVEGVDDVCFIQLETADGTLHTVNCWKGTGYTVVIFYVDGVED